MTSKPYADECAVQLVAEDFERGSLRITSYARPGKLFTAHEDLFVAEAGLLKSTGHRQIVDAVIALLGGNS